jgi:RHS repeat-associated protein
VGSTANAFLFNGQQWDANEELYFLRARYYQANKGRFVGQDAFSGLQEQPYTLHRYAYGLSDPVNRVDPSGNFSFTGLAIGTLNWAVRYPEHALSALTTLASVSLAFAGYNDLADSVSNAIPPHGLGMPNIGSVVASGKRQLSYMVGWSKGWNTIHGVIGKAGRNIQRWFLRTFFPLQHDESPLAYGVQFLPNDFSIVDNNIILATGAKNILEEFAKQQNAVTINQYEWLLRKYDNDWVQVSLHILDVAQESGRKVLFNLDHMVDFEGVLARPNGIGQHAGHTTSIELRYIRDNWEKFKDIVTFYSGGQVASPPWQWLK